MKNTQINNLLKKIGILFLFLFSNYIIAQGTTCINAEVLCTPNAAFPAQTSAADLGPLPSCGTNGQAPGFPVNSTLSSTPNPAFYTLQVVESGDLFLFINTSPAKDVDFAIWGPFASPDVIANCSGNNFPPGAPIDCDYSTDSSEQIDVSGVLAGQTYILMIANYSGEATDVTLSPNNDHGINTATLGGPLGFDVIQPDSYSVLDSPANMIISPAITDPNISSVNFSGTGITDATNGVFDPSVAGVGIHTVTVTGTSYACSVVRTIDINVHNLLVADNDTLGTALVPLASGASDVPAGSVLTGDTLNGVQVTPANTDVNPVTTGNILIDADGNVTILANTPTGSYPVIYAICESGANPANCTIATVTVEVVGELVANIDDFTGTPLTIGDPSPSVIADDTLDGAAVVIGINPGQVTLNGTTVPSEVTLNSDGTITVNAGAPSGTYEVTYEICENGANPANCKSNTATVLVENPLVANIDDFTGT
ncbi:hypothetical protein G1K73_13125, partial [Tenacibaculum finnmarkense]|nr:hypothetical protein [Tenacibaculum finnmarkense]